MAQSKDTRNHGFIVLYHMKESIFPSPDDILCHVGPAQSLQLRDNIPTGNNRSSSCSSRSRLLSTRSLLILLLRFDLFLLDVFSGGLFLLLTLGDLATDLLQKGEIQTYEKQRN